MRAYHSITDPSRSKILPLMSDNPVGHQMSPSSKSASARYYSPAAMGSWEKGIIKTWTTRPRCWLPQSIIMAFHGILWTQLYSGWSRSWIPNLKCPCPKQFSMKSTSIGQRHPILTQACALIHATVGSIFNLSFMNRAPAGAVPAQESAPPPLSHFPLENPRPPSAGPTSATVPAQHPSLPPNTVLLPATPAPVMSAPTLLPASAVQGVPAPYM